MLQDSLPTLEPNQIGLAYNLGATPRPYSDPHLRSLWQEEVRSMRSEFQNALDRNMGLLEGELRSLQARVLLLEEQQSMSPASGGCNNITRLSGYDLFDSDAQISVDVARAESERVAQTGKSLAPNCSIASSVKIEGGTHLPASLYNFQCAQLASTNATAQDKMHAGLLALLLFAMQLVMGYAFADTSILKFLLRSEKEADPIGCFYQKKNYEHVPLIELAAGTVALALVCLALKQDDMETLLSMSVIASASRCKRFVLHLFLAIRAVVFPLWLLSGVAFQMAASEDAVDIVMNALQSAFLLEVDNILFTAWLSKEQQTAYMGDHNNDCRTVVGAVRVAASLYLVNTVYSLAAVRLIIFVVGDACMRKTYVGGKTICTHLCAAFVACLGILGMLLFSYVLDTGAQLFFGADISSEAWPCYLEKAS